jgi:hypothetical protein
LPERIANIVIVVEDVEQQNLVFRYLEQCIRGVTYRWCRFERPAKGSGSGEQFVRNRYPAEVLEHRRRAARASALLVVVVDADTGTTKARATQLSHALRDARIKQRGAKEPIVVLTPKRHVETWIRVLLGNQVDEVTDYTKAPYSPPVAEDIQNAAVELHKWTRPGAGPGAKSPPSLTDSIPEWRKIPC